jgi:AraC-like DNA-binding protein
MVSVAESLHMVFRTLRQKLSAEGEGFTHMKDSLSRDQAINLLKETRLTIGEVGQRVRFTRPAAFSLAFRQWTGMSPFGYRQGLSYQANFSVTTGI